MTNNELEFVDVQKGFVTFKDSKNKSYKTKIIPALKSAIISENKTIAVPTQKVSLQNIQALLRQGKSIEEVALISSIDEVRISKYNDPIDQEKKYILNSFLKTEVKIPFEIVTIEKLIDNFLESKNLAKSEFIATKNGQEPWTISLFLDNTKKQQDQNKELSAIFEFDPVNNLATPQNELAIAMFDKTLVSENLPTDGIQFPAAANTQTETNQAVFPQSPTETQEAVPDETPETKSNQTEISEVEDTIEHLPIHNLVKVTPETQETILPEHSTEPVVRISAAEELENAEDNSSAPAKNNKRPKLPEWDEILFGSKRQ